MAEKVSESAWTGFTKKHKLELDDGPLRKVLAAFDKTDEAKPEPRLKALEEVIKQIPEQVKLLVKRKKELGDKPFGEAKDKLYALLEEAEALQKKSQAAAAAADKKDDDDEEPDTPVLLTTKMIPLLRELRKGEAQMNAMICTAGKNTAVLIMRRSISPSRRKLLAEAVDAKGGMKYIVGECQFENKVLTFVVQSPASQLAKRIRQALLEQTEMRFKVKVRGDDGVEENDGEDEGEEQPAAQAQKQAAPPGGPASAEQTLYVQRLRKVRERYEQALKEQHPEATKLRAVMGYASEKADEQKDYVAASKALEQLEKLLGGPGAKAAEAPVADGPMARGTAKATPAPSSATQAPTPDGGAARSPPLVVLQQTRLAWDKTRKTIQTELAKLEASVLAACQADEGFDLQALDVSALNGVLERLDSRLIDQLDAALNAQDPVERSRLNQQAKAIVGEYLAFVNEDPLMADIDDSGFAPVAVRKTALATLTLLSSKL